MPSSYINALAILLIDRARTSDALISFLEMRACVNVRAKALHFDNNCCRWPRTSRG
jgi:hypothetical protein